MTLSKRIGYGCSLAVDEQGGTSFATLGNIVEGWTGPDTTADVVETTVLGDTFKTFERSQIDPGSVQFTIAYDPNDQASQVLVSLYNSGVTANWRISFYDTGDNDDTTETFAGFIESLSREMNKGSLVQATVGIKVSGDPGYTALSGSQEFTEGE